MKLPMITQPSFRFAVKSGVFLFLGGLIPCIHQANAALLTYEGFNTGLGGYSSAGGYAGGGDALVFGNSPGTGQDPATLGFTGPWSTGNQQAENVYSQIRNLQTLSYSVGGQTLQTTTGEVTHFRTSGTPGTKSYTRLLDTTPSGTANTHSTLYFSGMFSFTGGVSAAVIESSMGSIADIPGSRKFSMHVAPDGSMTLNGNSAVPAVSAAGTIVSGQTYFFVWKLENDGNNDVMTLYLNPMNLLSENGNASTLQIAGGTFMVVNNSNYELTHLRFGSAPNEGQGFLFDEFRIGTQWSDVVPLIPEPSSGLLGAAGLATMMFRRWRA
jgi:hypothetical protein